MSLNTKVSVPTGSPAPRSGRAGRSIRVNGGDGWPGRQQWGRTQWRRVCVAFIISFSLTQTPLSEFPTAK